MFLFVSTMVVRIIFSRPVLKIVGTFVVVMSLLIIAASVYMICEREETQHFIVTALSAFPYGIYGKSAFFRFPSLPLPPPAGQNTSYSHGSSCALFLPSSSSLVLGAVYSPYSALPLLLLFFPNPKLHFPFLFYFSRKVFSPLLKTEGRLRKKVFFSSSPFSLPLQENKWTELLAPQYHKCTCKNGML